MSVIGLAGWVAAESFRIAEANDRGAEEARADLEKQLPISTLDDVSPCCGKPVDYSLGTGNPVCPDCGMPICYQE